LLHHVGHLLSGLTNPRNPGYPGSNFFFLTFQKPTPRPWCFPGSTSARGPPPAGRLTVWGVLFFSFSHPPDFPICFFFFPYLEFVPFTGVAGFRPRVTKSHFVPTEPSQVQLLVSPSSFRLISFWHPSECFDLSLKPTTFSLRLLLLLLFAILSPVLVFLVTTPFQDILSHKTRVIPSMAPCVRSTPLHSCVLYLFSRLRQRIFFFLFFGLGSTPRFFSNFLRGPFRPIFLLSLVPQPRSPPSCSGPRVVLVWPGAAWSPPRWVFFFPLGFTFLFHSPAFLRKAFNQHTIRDWQPTLALQSLCPRLCFSAFCPASFFTQLSRLPPNSVADFSYLKLCHFRVRREHPPPLSAVFGCWLYALLRSVLTFFAVSIWVPGEFSTQFFWLLFNFHAPLVLNFFPKLDLDTPLVPKSPPWFSAVFSLVATRIFFAFFFDAPWEVFGARCWMPNVSPMQFVPFEQTLALHCTISQHQFDVENNTVCGGCLDFDLRAFSPPSLHPSPVWPGVFLTVLGFPPFPPPLFRHPPLVTPYAPKGPGPPSVSLASRLCFKTHLFPPTIP